MTKGTALHQAGRGDYIIRAGDVYVINPGATHALEKMEDLHQCHVMFDPADFLRPISEDLKKLAGYHALFVLDPASIFKNRLRLKGSHLTKARHFIDTMIREFTEKNLGYQTVLKGVFSQYVALLCRAYMDRAPGDDSSLPLAQTVSHMETHFHEPLRLEDLACRAHYSVPQFCRLFRKYFGTSPVDYLLKLRVQQAGELLKDGSHSITAISQACGFSDSNYFSRQFRRVMGRTPRAFRRTFSEII